jgi:hypothetical protein
MTSIATNHIAFPDRVNPLTERRTTAQAWKNALTPLFQYVNIVPVEIDGEMKAQVVADNGQERVVTLRPSTQVRGHYDLWDVEVYFRSLEVGRLTQVGNLNDLLTFITRDI